MNKDEVIPQLKEDFVDWSTGLGYEALASQIPIVRIPIISVVVKYYVRKQMQKVGDAMDLAGYFEYKTTLNKKEAVSYQDSISDYKTAIASGDKNAIARARDEKNRRFAIIARLGNAP